jgi:hypothetical protein
LLWHDMNLSLIATYLCLYATLADRDARKHRDGSHRVF